MGGGGKLCLCMVVGLLQFCACVCVWWWVFILYFFYIDGFFKKNIFYILEDVINGEL